MTDRPENSEKEPSVLERGMRLFGDVRAGEGPTAVLMFLNIHFLLGAFYILKTVREPLILLEVCFTIG